MSSLDKQQFGPLRAPAGKGSGPSKEEWPAVLPDFCKGVEVYPDEPYLSLGDALGKIQKYRPDDDRDFFDSDHNIIDAASYWLERSEKFYQDNPNIVGGLSVVKPLFGKLKAQLTQKQRDAVTGTLDELWAAHKSLGKTFQLETGKLLTSSAIPLFPLMRKGMNPKILDIIIEPVSKEKAASLLGLLADHESGKLDVDGLKTGAETLFAEELK